MKRGKRLMRQSIRRGGRAVCRILPRGRRGSEIVEAAIVLPLMMLAILSMIVLLLFWYEYLCAQIDLHEKLCETARLSDHIFRMTKMNMTSEKQMRGLVGMLMRKDFEAYCYELNERKALLFGKVILDAVS